jgi:hypothetical protein
MTGPQPGCGSPVAARRGIGPHGGRSPYSSACRGRWRAWCLVSQVPGLARSSALAAPRPGPTGTRTPAPTPATHLGQPQAATVPCGFLPSQWPPDGDCARKGAAEGRASRAERGTLALEGRGLARPYRIREANGQSPRNATQDATLAPRRPEGSRPHYRGLSTSRLPVHDPERRERDVRRRLRLRHTRYSSAGASRRD